MAQFRVMFEGGSNYYEKDVSAKSRSERLAALGIPNELETRPRNGMAWRLVLRYTPTGGGKFRIDDPYMSTNKNLVAFDEDSFRGRVVQ